MANQNPPQEPAPPKGEADYQRMVEMSKAGDIAGLVESLVHAPRDYGRLQDIPVLLREAVNNASRRSPRKFCGEVHRQMMSFVTYVAARLQVYVESAMLQADEHRGHLRERLPEQLTALLPHIVQMARISHELAASWAATDRRWGLARQRKRRRGNRLDQMFDGSPN